MLFPHHPVIHREDPRNGCEENGIPAHEREEGLGRADYFPGDDDPSSDDSGDDASALDVNVAGEKNREVVCGADGVCGDVGADLCDVPRGGCEECGGPSAVSEI